MEGTDPTDQLFGFFDYGSGAKAKVFEGTVQPEWKSVAARIGLSNSSVVVYCHPGSTGAIN